MRLLTTNAVKQRPLSPHLSIYRPQLTWIMSIGHRVTGAAMAAALYAFGITYALAPATGTLTDTVERQIHALPVFIHTGSKMLVSVPFFFHMYNGIRHLVWDSVNALSLRAVYIGGWTVNILTLTSSLWVSIFKS